MRKLFWIPLVIVLAIALIFSGCPKPAPPEKPIELTMVDFKPDIPPGNYWPRLFVDKVASISNGAMVIKFIGGPEAVPAMDSAAAAQRGSIDIASAMSLFTPVPVTEVLGYCEYSSAEMRERGAWNYIQDLYDDYGIYFLGASTPSEAQVQVTFFFKKEINKLEDFAGLRIASVGGSHKGVIEALGATCVPIDFTDYFTAMERGTVDAYNVGTPGIQDFGLTPVTGCLLDEPISSCGSFFLMNLDRWNSLSKNQQDILTQAIIETEIEGAAAWSDLLVKVKADISAEGVKIVKFSPEDSRKFYKTYRDSVWAEAYQRYPKDIVDELFELITDPNFYRLK